MGAGSGTRACIFSGNLPSTPALRQRTSQQHRKGADASESLRMVKLHSQADNSTAETGNLHGTRSTGAARKLVAGGQGKHEPPDTHLKAREPEQASWKVGPKSNIP